VKTLALATLLLAAAACAGPVATLRPVADRVLVVARTTTPEDRPIAEDAADRLAELLRRRVTTLRAGQFLRETTVHAAHLWAPRLLEQLERGGWPSPDEAGALASRLQIAEIVAVEVTTYAQAWGRRAKTTRVGLAAHAFDVQAGAPYVSAHADVALSEEHGRAFRAALDDAVNDLAGLLLGRR